MRQSGAFLVRFQDLVGFVHIQVVVRVSLEFEHADIGEERVAIPGVSRCDFLQFSCFGLLSSVGKSVVLDVVRVLRHQHCVAAVQHVRSEELRW